MASLTRRTWVWVSSRSWWWTGRPGVLRFMVSQRVGHDWVTELNWTECLNYKDCWEDAVNLSPSLSIDLISSARLHFKAFFPLPSVSMGFPCGSAGKESTCSVGDLGLIPGLGRFPWKRERLPTPVFRPGDFHGLYSPGSRKELDTTEWLSLSLSVRDF